MLPWSLCLKIHVPEVGRESRCLPVLIVLFRRIAGDSRRSSACHTVIARAYNSRDTYCTPTSRNRCCPLAQPVTHAALLWPTISAPPTSTLYMDVEKPNLHLKFVGHARSVWGMTYQCNWHLIGADIHWAALWVLEKVESRATSLHSICAWEVINMTVESRHKGQCSLLSQLEG